VAVSPITSDYGIFAANASSTTGQANTQADSDMFLKLMVAQMKYQDPMNPTDSSQMLTQNAIFTEVQAVQEMQKEMGMVLSSQMAFGTAAMIGQNVSWVDANGALQTGKATGAAFGASGPVLLVGDQQVPVSSIAGLGDTSGYDFSANAGDTSTSVSGTSPTGYVTSTNS
jgi:flagellar basal-body rod modification protein FlgD